MAARRAHASGTGLSTARRARCGAEDVADLALNVLDNRRPHRRREPDDSRDQRCHDHQHAGPLDRILAALSAQPVMSHRND